ncbi:MAG: DHH family phosphoesterase [Oscillospiraceae bacterium]|nr:DHH family phosphoesterase [Oscillospiraceae bacterium]
MHLCNIDQAAALLRAAEDVLIITHIRPDGDAAGSGCALCLGLRAMGKRAFLAKNPPSMGRYEKYMTPYFAPADFVPAFVVAVDTPGPGQYPPGWGAMADRTDLSIDHHGTNSGCARATLLEGDSAAAGELVYLVLEEMGVSLSPAMAEALYVALATDTNGFRTADTTPRTLYIASRLYDQGFDTAALTRSLFETKSAPRLGLESFLFGSMEFPKKDVCVMTLPLAAIHRCGAGEDDMDKISLLTMVPEGVKYGLLLRELEDGTWKVSLRTDGSANAGDILRSVGGGGHAAAAGAVLSGGPEAIERAVLAALETALS